MELLRDGACKVLRRYRDEINYMGDDHFLEMRWLEALRPKLSGCSG